MHTDSRMAPQHPRNEMNTTIEPIVINTIGRIAWGGKPTCPLTSMVPMLFRINTPKTIPKMPIIWKNQFRNVFINIYVFFTFHCIQYSITNFLFYRLTFIHIFCVVCGFYTHYIKSKIVYSHCASICYTRDNAKYYVLEQT